MKKVPFKVCLLRKKFISKSRTQALQKCPQRKGVCLKVFKTTPRKPNAGKRNIAKVLLTNSKIVDVYIPGIKHNLQKHSRVLIRGGRAQDTPGINYRCIRGKYDLDSLFGRKNKRSKYGVKKL